MDRICPHVLLVGDVQHPEFQDSVGWLREHTSLEVAVSVPEAIDLAQGSVRAWHTVILAQSRPGRFSARDVERLSRAIPLAHLVALLGSLCEGEMRGNSPGPGVARVYWHQFLLRSVAELQVVPPRTSWQLPRTASELERAEAAFKRPPVQRSGLVAVFTHRALQFDALATACRQAGYATAWCSSERRSSARGAVAAIWDGSTQEPPDFAQLARVAALMAPAPTIALLAFPRLDQVHRARAHGAESFVSSPFLLPDLWHALHAATAGGLGNGP